jgi:peptidoglycan/LPS O-acetylase OafA/YrhL
MVQGFYGNFFAAVPAVIVFFVISGFCIHYPYRGAGSFDLTSYLVRRYLRISIPMVAAILLAGPFNVKLSVFQNSILWSLVAELIYYSLYPILRRLRERFGWNRIIAASFVVAYGTILLHPGALDYSPFGPLLSWLIAFPCWLLGCRLAEVDLQKSAPATAILHVWRWRAGIWFLSWLCSVLRFHSPVGYPWTLNLFAIAVFFWLQIEISAFRARPPWRILEWAGRWSYSVYLMHMIANAAFARLAWPNFGFNLNWTLKMAFILSVSYAFYLVLELPAHHIARNLSRRIRRRIEGQGMPVPPSA